MDKDFFVGHILVELLLDKVLLDKEPTLADSFYDIFKNVELDRLLKYLRYFGLMDDELFVHGFEKFLELEYLKTYTSHENVVYAVDKVVQRTGLEPLTDGQKQLLERICVTIEPHLEKSIGDLELTLL